MELDTLKTGDEYCVVFRNTKEHYDANESISCQFTVAESFSDLDNISNYFVGIFHVGWEQLSEAVARKSFSLVESLTDGVQEVVFTVLETPDSNANEFYQFCFYDEQQSCVLGASGPFQITSSSESESYVRVDRNVLDQSCDSLPNSNSFVSQELEWCFEGTDVVSSGDDNDTVMVHNKTTMLEDSLTKVVLENTSLKEKNAALEQFVKELENNVKSLFSEKDQLSDQVRYLQNAISCKEEDKNEAILELEDKVSLLQERESLVLDQLSKRTESMKLENVKLTEEYESKLKNCCEAIEQLTDDRNSVAQKKTALEKELANRGMSHSEQMNMVVLSHDAERSALRKECEEFKRAVLFEKEANAKLERDYQEIVSSLAKQLEELGEQNSSTTQSLERALELEVKLKAEHQKNCYLQEELDALSSSTDKLEQDLKEAKECHQQSILRLNAACVAKDDLLKEATDEKSTMEKQLELLSAESACKAEQLQLALKASEEEVSSLRETSQREHDAFQEVIQELSEKATNLKEREHDLLMASEELKAEVICLNKSLVDERDLKTLVVAEMQERLTEKEEELQLLRENIGKFELEKSNRRNKSSHSGSHHALQVANAHMQKQLTQLKQEKHQKKSVEKELSSPSTISTSSTELLKKENDDLRLRLCMGKNAYKTKYQECQKLKQEIQKLKSGPEADSDLPVLPSICPSCEGFQAELKKVSEELDDTKKMIVATDEHTKQLDDSCIHPQVDSSGCSDQKKYSSLKTDYDALKRKHETAIFHLTSEIKKLEDKLSEKQSKVDEVKLSVIDSNEQTNCLSKVTALEEKVQDLEEENSMLKRQKQTLLKSGLGKRFSPPPHASHDSLKENQVGSDVTVCEPPKSVQAAAIIQKQPEPSALSATNQVIYHPPSYQRELAEELVKSQPFSSAAIHKQPSSGSGVFANGPAIGQRSIRRPPTLTQPFLQGNSKISSLYESLTDDPLPMKTSTDRHVPYFAQSKEKHLNRLPKSPEHGARRKKCAADDSMEQKSPARPVPTPRPAAPSAAIIHGRDASFNSEPLFHCPVCGIEFPPGSSDVSATHHVNSHFRDT